MEHLINEILEFCANDKAEVQRVINALQNIEWEEEEEDGYDYIVECEETSTFTVRFHSDEQLSDEEIEEIAIQDVCDGNATESPQGIRVISIKEEE